MKMAKQKTGRAFTLVELLVVIAIIALLLSILMPALSKVRDQARMIMCATRLKDIGLAFNLYTNDNKNQLPTSYRDEIVNVATGEKVYARWPVKVAPYYKEAQLALQQSGGQWAPGLYLPMFHCPTQEKKYKGDAPGVYGYNVFFTDVDKSGTTYNWRRIDDIKQPGELPLLACTNGDSMAGIANSSAGITGGGGGLVLWYSGPHPLAKKYGFISKAPYSTLEVGGPAPNHRGKCNFVFADFHVESRNICSKDNWPWFNKINGTSFHPKRDVRINP